MVQPTPQDQIAAWDYNDPSDIVAASQALASSVQTAFFKRERYNYVWPTQAERAAETGMVQGSTGYQIDTKSEYIYDNSVWRLGTAYGEFNASMGSVAANGAYQPFSSIAIDNTRSTSLTMATVTDGGATITLADPGLYAMSVYSVCTSFITINTRGYVQIGEDPNPNLQISREYFLTNTSTAMCTLPFYRSPAANQKLYFWHWFGNGTTPATLSLGVQIRIGRLA